MQWLLDNLGLDQRWCLIHCTHMTTEESLGLASPTAPDSLDHLLVHGLTTVAAPQPWPSEQREIAWRGGLRVRLSDHAPVTATFERAG